MRKSVLILGANGRFGRHAAAAFWNAGWSIHPFERTREDLMQAAATADVIVAGWNPAYRDWAAQVPALHARIQAAARASGATVILPGNVYVYAPDTPLPWGPDRAHRATNPLGRIRVDLEASYRRSGVQTIVLRAGDFIDTEHSGNWLDKVILRGLCKGRISYPGPVDVPHAWAYLPDLACAAVALAEKRSELGQFEDLAFDGYTLTANQMAAILSDITRRPVQARPMSWLPIQAARPFWPEARYLLEMRYLWQVPHRLDCTRLAALCPQLPVTPPEEALKIAATPFQRVPRHCRCQSISRSTQTIR
ncbi:dTDP-4-dehydrorhamnose reductase [Roseovarius lutimaris]|uniref:dTDP-4-dehydrorhamnose reductase n=1 Tax=Roseovarius lutimaris TaxID=1005928 RepID=A0A1I5CW01_9RHOB|nr:sugar nucleotide-binding protein [Roseovarius lutimaris]SFN91132.1 dTDP-4-dehydrorhamnose reductase [Roseovarius lutimaris]